MTEFERRSRQQNAVSKTVRMLGRDLPDDDESARAVIRMLGELFRDPSVEVGTPMVSGREASS